MTVYHGSYAEIRTPDIDIGRFNLDFGKGFYVTTLRLQAEKWAVRRTARTQSRPVISVYDFDLRGLAVLSFDGYTSSWLDFVAENRTKGREVAAHPYDAIFGNIADDDVAATIDEYMRLLSQQRVNEDVRKATLYQLSFSQPNDQYCIATQKAIHQLTFQHSYHREG